MNVTIELFIGYAWIDFEIPLILFRDGQNMALSIVLWIENENCLLIEAFILIYWYYMKISRNT